MRRIHVAASWARGVLTIEWDAGVRSEYLLRGLLRAACPCAEYRGGHEAMGGPGSPDLLLQLLPEGRSAELQSLGDAGNCTRRPTWKDGQSFGIYSWAYLRQLSPGCALDGSGV
jgi:DUF971 family protein